ncbi:MAG: TRAP transporter substrate-binding protein DctP [Treponema sp.]|jgi:TRAP-type C4-dicarboxylate transport system substrate-binding protein|nr:TRAP transporter substrate-binding protein DctP [Treponema sp.]
MKITKKILLGLLVIAACAAFTGCKRQAERSSGGRAPERVVVTFVGTEAVSTGQSRMMQEVANKLNASGRFHADVQVEGAFSGDVDYMVAQARNGEPLVVPSDPGRLASQFNIPDLNILMSPYVLIDKTVLERLPDTALFKEWQSQLERHGITFVADMYNGFRSFYTTTPVNTLADLKGLRIRGFNNNIGAALAKYLDFVNVGVSWGEVPSGLQEKTLDGCEVQVATAYGSAIYDAVKYLALTKHYMLQSSFVCSTALLNKMSEDDRQFFLNTIRETASKYNHIIASHEEIYYQQMESKGVTITEVDLKEFQSAIEPLYANNDLSFSAGLKDRLFRELGL